MKNETQVKEISNPNNLGSSLIGMIDSNKLAKNVLKKYYEKNETKIKSSLISLLRQTLN